MEKSFYRTLINFDFTQKATLCSLIQWKGSVPRKDYPLMLVLENGDTFGTIGGGNVEHQVVEKAGTVLETDRATFEKFDLTNADAMSEGGLCGGITKILIEPYTRHVRDFWQSLHYLDRQESDMVVVTEITQGEPISSRRHLLYPESSVQSFPNKVTQAIQTVWAKGKSITVETAGKHFLVQLMLAPPILHIFGAGHIAKAVADLTHFIDLDTHIYDDRKEMANSSRFPEAKHISNEAFSILPSHVQISPSDYVLIATRGHELDLELMRWLLTIDVSYLGLVSSQRKWRIVSNRLGDEGFASDRLKAVHAPVGLDIESETVPEIAVSIISEIVHHYRAGGRSTHSLSRKTKRPD